MFGETSLSLDHPLRSVCNTASQWPYVSIRCYGMLYISAYENIPVSYCHSPFYISITTVHITVSVSPCHWQTVWTIFYMVRQGKVRNDSSPTDGTWGRKVAHFNWDKYRQLETVNYCQASHLLVLHKIHISI